MVEWAASLTNIVYWHRLTDMLPVCKTIFCGMNELLLRKSYQFFSDLIFNSLRTSEQFSIYQSFGQPWATDEEAASLTVLNPNTISSSTQRSPRAL